MKLEIPQKSKPKEIKEIGLISLEKHCTNIAVTEYPIRMQLYTKPLMVTESVNSDILKERTGS